MKIGVSYKLDMLLYSPENSILESLDFLDTNLDGIAPDLDFIAPTEQFLKDT